MLYEFVLNLLSGKSECFRKHVQQSSGGLVACRVDLTYCLWKPWQGARKEESATLYWRLWSFYASHTIETGRCEGSMDLCWSRWSVCIPGTQSPWYHWSSACLERPRRISLFETAAPTLVNWAQTCHSHLATELAAHAFYERYLRQLYLWFFKAWHEVKSI